MTRMRKGSLLPTEFVRSIRRRLSPLLVRRLGPTSFRSGFWDAWAERRLRRWGLDAWPALLEGLKNSPAPWRIPVILAANAEHLADAGEKDAIPYLVDLIRNTPQESPQPTADIIRDRLLWSLYRLGGREALMAMLNMLEDAGEWMKATIASKISGLVKDDAFDPEVEVRVARIAEQALSASGQRWAVSLFPALVKHGTPDAQRVFRRSLLERSPVDVRQNEKEPLVIDSSHPMRAGLKTLARVTWLDSTWIDDLANVPMEMLDPDSAKNLCSALGGIPESRSVGLLLERFSPRCRNSPATDGIIRIAKGPGFPLDRPALAVLEETLIDCWESGAYRQQALALLLLAGNFPDTPLARKTISAKQMIHIWTGGELKELLPTLCPLDEVLDTESLPEAPKYIEGTLEDVLQGLKTFDSPKLEQSPHLHEQKPYYCSKHLAAIAGSWQGSSDFYGAIVAGLYRLKRGTYGCCCRGLDPGKGDFEALGPARFFSVLAW